MSLLPASCVASARPTGPAQGTTSRSGLCPTSRRPPGRRPAEAVSLTLLLLLACQPDPPAPTVPSVAISPAAPAARRPSAPPAPGSIPDDWPRPPPGALPEATKLPSGAYAELVAAIEADRHVFAGYDARDQARAYLREAITRHLIPAWAGTPWAFYGTAKAPGEGDIACGYWVASILRDVGFRVNRDQLGRQASEKILLTFAEPARLRHYPRRPVTEVITWVRQAGEGLWGAGLANHAGFVWNDGQEVYFCHSNYNGVRGPECEVADQSWAFNTSYTVIASLLEDATVDAWLEGRALPTGRFTASPAP